MIVISEVETHKNMLDNFSLLSVLEAEMSRAKEKSNQLVSLFIENYLPFMKDLWKTSQSSVIEGFVRSSLQNAVRLSVGEQYMTEEEKSRFLDSKIVLVSDVINFLEEKGFAGKATKNPEFFKSVIEKAVEAFRLQAVQNFVQPLFSGKMEVEEFGAIVTVIDSFNFLEIENNVRIVKTINSVYNEFNKNLIAKDQIKLHREFVVNFNPKNSAHQSQIDQMFALATDYQKKIIYSTREKVYLHSEDGAAALGVFIENDSKIPLGLSSGANVLLFDKDGHILLIRDKNRNTFGAPGGKVDEGETHEQAAERELLEEARITCEINPQHLASITGFPYHRLPGGIRWVETANAIYAIFMLEFVFKDNNLPREEILERVVVPVQSLYMGSLEFFEDKKFINKIKDVDGVERLVDRNVMDLVKAYMKIQIEEGLANPEDIVAKLREKAAAEKEKTMQQKDRVATAIKEENERYIRSFTSNL